MDPVAALQMMGGAARWVDLRRAGVSRGALVVAVRERVVERPHRGCFVLPGTARLRELELIFRARRTCVTALADLYPDSTPRTARAHLAVPLSRGLGTPRQRPVHEVVLHRVERPSAPDPLAWIDVAAECVVPADQVAMADAALRSGAISHADLTRLTRGTARRRAWVRDHVDARAESLPETYARMSMKMRGLQVVPQPWLAGAGRIDFLVEDVLYVEVDGRSHHISPEAFVADRTRDRRAHLVDMSVVRFAAQEVLAAPREVGEEVAAILWRRGLASPTLRTRMDRAARQDTFDPWDNAAWRAPKGS